MIDTRKIRKLIGDDLWRSLLERYIQVGMLWQDSRFKTWHAYGHYPRGMEESYWNGDGDALRTAMGSGDTPEAAVKALIASPNFAEVAGVQRVAAIAGIEMGRLARTYGRAAGR